MTLCGRAARHLRSGRRAVAGRRCALLLALALAGQGAAADGFYASADYSASQPLAVLSVDRGRLNYAAAVGQGSDDRLWAKAAVMWLWQRGKVRLKFGTSVYAREQEAWKVERAREAGVRLLPEIRAGLRAGADSYVDRGPWASYWMLEYDTTQHAALALASGTWKRTGVGVELSVWKQEDDPVAPTLLVRWTLPRKVRGADVALRAGWRFKDDEAFLGVSVSRFR